ncbi:MAG: MOSC domain-containing protein [Flavobacteriales bacterium]
MTASVLEIYVYPIKSMAGVRLMSCPVERYGLARDREFMLVDDQGVFISQRQEPKMALMDVGFTSDGLQLDATRLGLSACMQVITEDFAQQGTAEIWGQSVEVLYGPQDVDDFFSHLFERSCRLVRMPPDRRRMVTHAQDVHETSFADSLPIMMANVNSLHALNDRIQRNGVDQVAMDRFRPNIVLAGIPAFAEDGFSTIGNLHATFEVLKACSRCVLVNVNQQTAFVGQEPLRTLADFRRFGNKVHFGIHTRMISDPFTLAVGDELTCFNEES